MITPNEQYTRLGAAVGYNDLYFKREDLHPYGSHKGRSIPTMIDYHFAKGSKSFAISSSGSAALAAALYIKDLPEVKLEIFLGGNITPQKLDKLTSLVEKINEPDRIKITRVDRPTQALMQAAQKGATSLRQSTDDIALSGYESLAKEILAVKKVGAVFMGTSSGTTAQALAQYFIKENAKVQVHIVQTATCHPLAEAFATCDTEETSIADAIVDRVAFRKAALIPLIKQTGGFGWCATNEDIRVAQKLTKTYTNLDISTNSALSVVGAMKAGRAKHKIEGPVVCIISGD